MKHFLTTLIAGLLFFSCSEKSEESDKNNVSNNDKEQNSDSVRTAMNDVPAETSGLLLGIDTQDGPKSYWITFNASGMISQTAEGFYLSPQKDGFYMVSEIEAHHDVQCDFVDHDGQETTGPCGYTVSEMVYGPINDFAGEAEDAYHKAKSRAKSLANCWESGAMFQHPILIGNGFIEYTVGGHSSECAPDGPGGGFEKDTIISIYGKTISPYASEYLDGPNLDQMYYGKLSNMFSKEGEIDTTSSFYFPAKEMRIFLTYKHGRIMMYVRNNFGRNYQDSWEEEEIYGEAPGEFQSYDLPDYASELIRDYSAVGNIIISPVDSVYGLYIPSAKMINFQTYPDDQALGSIQLKEGKIIMAEWCSAENIPRWETAFENARKAFNDVKH